MENEENNDFLVQMTLSTGKKVVMAEPMVGDQDKAIERVALKGVDNATALSVMSQTELLKILLRGIDGKKVKGADRENLKTLFTHKEYMEVMAGMGELLGKPEKPQMEHVSASGLK